MSALKGFNANDESPTSVNALSPDWLNIEFGSWCANLNYNYGTTKYALNLFQKMPTDSELRAVLLHPSYDNWYILLNEPDLEGISTARAANTVNDQMAAVLAVTPNPKFCISCGTYRHPAYNDNSFFSRMWPLIARPRHVKAFHTHYYPYQTNISFNTYSRNLRGYLDDTGKSGKELWVTELGTVTGQTPSVTFDMNTAKTVADRHYDRWCWYAEKAIISTVAANYDCLLDSSGSLTANGTLFKTL